ncbi:MAG: ribonuclease HII [Pseudohongiellaceae bacterium]
MNRPVTRVVPGGQRKALAALFSAKGHTLAKNSKNRYVAFEVRTGEKSIFTFYTSGKLVSTVREGDGEGLLLEDDVATLLGGPPAKKEPSAPAVDQQAEVLLGADETGTGELLGAAIVGACLLPQALAPEASSVAGHVETKSSRVASGWNKLSEQLADLRGDGLLCTAVTIPNRLFDRYSKNGLLDLAYIRVVADLLTGSGRGAEDSLAGLQIVLDDYGAGRQLHGAVDGWRRRGADVRVETKADDRYLAPRLASVWARSARSREMVGLADSVSDGPLGSGNAGHPVTLAWLRGRAAKSGGWPSFVKASFKTVRRLDRLELVTKERVPQLGQLLDDQSAQGLLAGDMDLSAVGLKLPGGQLCSALEVDCSGRSVSPGPVPLGADFLPLLFGGLVLDLDELSLEQLDRLLDRESGLAAGWRVLAGPLADLADPGTVALLRAHAAGVLQLQPTAIVDPRERALRHGALRLTRTPDPSTFHLLLRENS